MPDEPVVVYIGFPTTDPCAGRPAHGGVLLVDVRTDEAAVADAKVMLAFRLPDVSNAKRLEGCKPSAPASTTSATSGLPTVS